MSIESKIETTRVIDLAVATYRQFIEAHKVGIIGVYTNGVQFSSHTFKQLFRLKEVKVVDAGPGLYPYKASIKIGDVEFFTVLSQNEYNDYDLFEEAE